MVSMDAVVEKAITLSKDLRRLITELLNHPTIKLDRQQQESVEMLLEGLDTLPWSQLAEEPPVWEPNEKGPGSPREYFDSFRAEPDKDEQRDIRKVYLRLSQAFHPDVARNDGEEAQFHRIMQQITDAYERHDMEALLHLERLHLGEVPTEGETGDMASRLDATILRLERESERLQQQADRLSAELKGLNESQLGKALTAEKRAKRTGRGGMSDDVEEMEEFMEMMAHAREAITEALAQGKMTQTLAEQLSPLGPAEADLFDLIFGDEEYAKDSYSHPDPYANVIARCRLDRRHPLATFLPKEFTVYCVESYAWPDTEVAVLLPPELYDRLPAKVFAGWVEAYYEYPLLEVPKRALKPLFPPPAFDSVAALAYGRRLLYEQVWPAFPADQQARLQAILLAKPHLSDMENWHAYFAQNPPPLAEMEAKLRPGSLMRIPPDFKMKGIMRGEQFEEAIIIYLQAGRKNHIVPLEELYITHGPQEWVERFEDYAAWGRQRLPMDFM